TVALLRAQNILAEARGFMEAGREDERNAALSSGEAQLAVAADRFASFIENHRTSATDGLADEVTNAVEQGYLTWVQNGLRPWHAAISDWNGLAANSIEAKHVRPSAGDFLDAVASYQEYGRRQGALAVQTASRMLDIGFAGTFFLLFIVTGVSI